MKDRRKSERKHTRFTADLLDDASGEYIGRVVNVTPEGMMVESDQPMDIDGIYRFRLPLPEPMNGRTELSLNGHCLWCHRGRNPAYYYSGMELTNVAHDDARTIEMMIRDAVFQRWVS
jgi:hypothetical protein